MSAWILGVLALAAGSTGGEPATAVEARDEPMHRTVYLDPLVRVWDVVIPAHGHTLYHIHRLDLAGVTIAPGPTRTETGAAPPEDQAAGHPGETWFAPHPQVDVHRVNNVGDSAIHLVALELQSAAKHAGMIRESGSTSGSVEQQNDTVRIVRYKLGVGERVPSRAGGHYVVVALGAGRIGRACGDTQARTLAAAGFVCAGSERSHSLTNAGESTLEILEFELAETE